MGNLIKKYAYINVMTTKEVAEKKKVTRQAISHDVKLGKLSPIKHTSSGMVFSKDDAFPNYDKKGNIVPRFFNDKKQLVELLIQNHKILLMGGVGSGKTTIIEWLKKEIGLTYPYIKLFDSDDVFENNILDWNIGSLVVIQTQCEIEGIELFAEQQLVNQKKVLDSIDYFCMIQDDQISILSSEDISCLSKVKKSRSKCGVFNKFFVL